MDRESASAVLATPLAQELLRSSPLAHLAYIGRDGYPRVIPTGYLWKGGKFVVCTPDNAPKVRGLGSNPRVALTIDTQTDRKSTRLNSSHLVISYAVFCLKKKTK